MFETMYNASGVGLAAPQVGHSIRLFIVDGTGFGDNEEDANDPLAEQAKELKEVFINPEVIEVTGERWYFEEGCLSIPDIREDVSREETVLIRYYDRDWNEKEEEFSGYAARIILHEYDHIEGVLFTDKLSPLRKRMLKRRLKDISKGNINVSYRMRFPETKKVKR
jgi:peptide deformylase